MAVYRIMVGQFYVGVDAAVIGVHAYGMEDVIYPEKEIILIVGDAHPQT